MRLAYALLLIPAAAHANPIEIGGALGGHAFSKNVELGVDDQMNEPGPKSAGMLGLRVGYVINARVTAEGEAMVIPTRDDVLNDSAMVYGVRAHARVDLLTTGAIRPFLVAGMGMHVLRSSSPQMSNDVDRSYHWGAGVRYSLNDRVDLRLDARHLIVPDRTFNGATSDFELTAGATYKFGVVPTYRPLPAPLPAAAPAGDRDFDGIPDNVDKCPDQPEDKDGFQDEDGCPDLDNDNDGIPDIADKCPNQPETINGWQDDDGCPDQVIAELTGIGFDENSATIDGYSNEILEHAYRILRDNPRLQVEISGHTSSEGDADFNLDLSLKRANAVKAWLVKKGIVEKRMFTIGHGADKPIGDNAHSDGRRKNRRIEFRILGPDEMVP
jgi:OmpA-OmpF porin, OOP family